MSPREKEKPLEGDQWWYGDPVKAEVRMVTGPGWPRCDSEGRQMFENTHFRTRVQAARHLLSDAESGVALAGLMVKQAREQAVRAEREAADAAVQYERVRSWLNLYGPDGWER